MSPYWFTISFTFVFKIHWCCNSPSNKLYLVYRTMHSIRLRNVTQNLIDDVVPDELGSTNINVVVSLVNPIQLPRKLLPLVWNRFYIPTWFLRKLCNTKLMNLLPLKPTHCDRVNSLYKLFAFLQNKSSRTGASCMLRLWMLYM